MENKEEEKESKILLIGLLVFCCLNLAFLDYKIFFSKSEKPESKFKEAVENKIPTTFLEKELKTCPALCLEKINEATSSITFKPQEKIVEKVAEKQTKIETATSPKEFFVPFGGSGSTTEGGWKDISGIEAYIDRGKYPDKIIVEWEASMKVKDNNGEAHARLFNVTKNTAVSYSEITSIGSDYKQVTSKKINLTGGNNLYRVQMFSTTQYEVFIQGARIKITVE